jgi:anti-sigma-K factor RskA
MMFIHCTIDELLAIRDGEGSRAALRHLDDCEECRDELDRLHQRVAALKALSALKPPRDRWSAVRERFESERRGRRRVLAAWTSLAAAASIAMAVGLSQLVSAVTAQPEDRLVSLMEESQNLQDMLQTFEPDSRVMNGRVATAVAVLEDRISDVDARIADVRMVRVPREQMLDLWRQRIELMDTLVKVHATKSTYVGF